MPKINSKDRKMEPKKGNRFFFFPKAEGGPQTIEAKDQAEAVKKLEGNSK